MVSNVALVNAFNMYENSLPTLPLLGTIALNPAWTWREFGHKSTPFIWNSQRKCKLTSNFCSSSFQKEVNRRKFSPLQTSPHIERGLNSKSQKPTTSRAFLASRDYGLYCLCAKGAISNTMLKHYFINLLFKKLASFKNISYLCTQERNKKDEYNWN